VIEEGLLRWGEGWIGIVWKKKGTSKAKKKDSFFFLGEKKNKRRELKERVK